MPAHPNDYRVDTTKLPQGGLLLKKTGWRKLRDDGNLRPGSKLMVAMEDSAVAMEVDALFAVADAQAAEEARAAEALEAARLAASKQGRSTSRLSSQSSRSVLVTGKLAHARAEPSERTQGPFDYFPRSPEWLANKHQQKNGARPQSRPPVRALTLEQRQFEAKRRLAAQAIASRFQAPQKGPCPLCSGVQRRIARRACHVCGRAHLGPTALPQTLWALRPYRCVGTGVGRWATGGRAA